MRPTTGSFAPLVFTILLSCSNDPKPVEARPARPDSVQVTQADKPAGSFAGIDISPMDMSYFPVDYPKLKMASHLIAPPVARVIYSRPHLGNRRLFPDILKYGEPWRLGANEATELDLYKDISILDIKVKAGRYNLYCIPQAGKWTIALNSNVDTWGLKQDTTLDVHRFDIPVTTGHAPQEYFTMEFAPAPHGSELRIAWDDVVGILPLTF